ncbi:LysM peptidoglycan-binding domain-containing protein [Noviherbaspirillum massiliense]|uniref:LysM peptidoglycan-binding domain-containing protein n=1 Tax=Noviherbaspirillum massiliense TaxID=1465823 RepID=UPI0003172B9F|nr:LysM peptidoglycan-binding domain-containing protein [Noviherbaspirillum massiliense]
MKKFSTAALILALGSASASWAATDAAKLISSRCSFLPNAPDQHKVVRGDTLWDISGKFLNYPWCWPQVWGMNRDQIRNPHWIYPGQIVYFDRAAGRLRLGKPTGDGGIPTERLHPQVRVEGLGQDAIPAIPAHLIEPFLSQPLVVEEDELQDTARIIAAQEGRVVIGKGDKAYVRGDLKGNTSFQVFRPSKPLKDPVTREVIGYEAAYLGTAKLQRAAKADDEAHIFTVTNVKEEISIGDRLLPMPPTPILSYVPHPPEQPVDARIVSIYGGVAQAGQNQIVSINRGKSQGIDVGTVLELYQAGTTIADPTDNKNPVKLPDERYGSLFIFRVFNNISYGLIMQVTDTVRVGDIAKSPE